MSDVGWHSGLKVATLKKYTRSDLLEIKPGGEPIYMHREDCLSFCDFACNGTHGTNIAKDILTLFPYYYRKDQPEAEVVW